MIRELHFAAQAAIVGQMGRLIASVPSEGNLGCARLCIVLQQGTGRTDADEKLGDWSYAGPESG
jgi:hypothetical protein